MAIAQSIIRRLPEFDYLYLGDTKRVPYGNRSQSTIHEFVGEALSYLFDQDCQLVILACNTASAESLRKSQQEYLPVNYPDRRVLGVLIPAVEAALEISEGGTLAVIATASTVESGAYEKEVQRQSPLNHFLSIAAPLLVPLVENDGVKYIQPVLADYLQPLNDRNIDGLILGCTHYCLIKQVIREMVACPVISQDEVVPDKLASYLDRHPEITCRLSRGGTRSYRVTDLSPGYEDMVRRLAGEPLELQRVEI
ncbi:MAG: glutamate racemase [Fimbriimonadaceae bacterium]|nr:glutamate racemase [Fimbriimonadaceae bacterium]